MKSLYLYFTLGYPDSRTLNNFISAIDSSDITGVELGFPSRDPHYDGPEIRKTHSVALTRGPDGADGTIELLNSKNIPLYCLAYFSDIGKELDQFLNFLSERKFRGIIIPDILVDYFDEYPETIESCRDHGIDLIPFVNASTPDSVIEDVCSRTRSWIYFGIQPSTGINVPFDLESASQRMREIIGERELVYGFGIKGTDQIRDIVKSGGDGIAIGSRFVSMLQIGDTETFTTTIKELRGALDDNA